jgi:hypothetical protein
MEAPPGFEPGVEVLQTSALPLGDGAPCRKTRGHHQTPRCEEHHEQRAERSGALGPHEAKRAERGEGPPRVKLERETGFEPATSTLARSHSTTELFPPDPPRYHTARLGFKLTGRRAGPELPLPATSD